MRTNSATFLVVFGVAVQRAMATGWVDFSSFSSPSNTDNHCNTDQQSGFNWNGLPTGDFDTYGQFDFSGFKCADSFHDKRDRLAPRNFQSKCIKGAVTKDAPSGPKISCGSGKRFSINDLQISSSEDTDLDLIYSYENGDLCRQTATCFKSGSTIKNSQCGGAIAVTFQLPKHVKRSGCEVGIHSVNFDCGPPSGGPQSQPSTSSLAPPPSAPASIPSVSVPSLSITYSIPKGNFSTPVELGTAPVVTPGTIKETIPGSVPSSSSGTLSVKIPLTTGSSPPPASSPPVLGSNPGPSIPAISAPFTTIPVATSSLPPQTVSDNTLVSGSTQAVVTTVNVYTTVTTCPVTYTVTHGTHEIVQSSLTVSTVVKTVISTICTKCIAPPSSTPVASTESSIAPVIGSSASSHISSPPSVPSIESSLSVSIPVTSALPSPSESSTSSKLATTQDVVTTVIIQTTVTTCPVTNTVTSGTREIIQTSKTVSTIFSTITSTICTRCVAPPTTPTTIVETSSASIVERPSASGSSVPAPPVPAPSVLPKCLNTWITLTTCANNADSDCYCKDSSFTKNVQDCVSSWTEDSDIIQSALSYLAGICAPHVPENPGIITCVPKSITLAPIPLATPAGPSVTGDVVTAPSNPSPPTPPAVTVISIVQTVTVPCTFSAGISAGQPIPASSITSLLSTKVTVPQVKFATENPAEGATGSPSIVLAAGSPAPAPAIPTVTSPSVPYGPAGGTTFATGVLPSGQRPPASTFPATFQGGVGRVATGSVSAVMVGLMTFLVILV